MPDILFSLRDIIVPFSVVILLLLIGLCGLILYEVTKFKIYLGPIVIFCSIGMFISLSICFYKFTIDDAYISLRYARNLANGYGLVFSTDGSHPVEGYLTFYGFLWRRHFSS